MTVRASILAELEELRSRDLLREPVVRGPGDGVVFDLSSNDYLGFAASPLAADALPGGAGASAMISGFTPHHARAGEALAAWLGTPTCLLFTSGYAANVGVISALAGKGDLVLSDRLNHASIIDGCRLSGATVVVYPHLDVGFVAAHLARHRGAFRRVLIATESWFSMDADGPDLVALRGVADQFEALLVVDEAHALGVVGPEGRGRCGDLGVFPDVLVGTLGKALGLQGAFAGVSHELGLLLWNRARSHVFSTAGSPAVLASVPERVQAVRRADSRRAAIQAFGNSLRTELSSLGVVVGQGPIVPVVVGDSRRAVELRGAFLVEGLLVGGIRPPTVPEGTARLRVVAGYSASIAPDDVLARVRRVVGRLA